jgi:integrase
VRIDGRDAFINRLGRWSDPVAVAKAHAIAAQVWSDYCQGTFDRSLMAYQPLIGGKEVGLLEALRVRAETKRQAAAIHAYKLLQRYDKPIRNRSDAEGFLGWLRAEGLGDSTIAGLSFTKNRKQKFDLYRNGKVLMFRDSPGEGDDGRRLSSYFGK